MQDSGCTLELQPGLGLLVAQIKQKIVAIMDYISARMKEERVPLASHIPALFQWFGL